MSGPNALEAILGTQVSTGQPNSLDRVFSADRGSFAQIYPRPEIASPAAGNFEGILPFPLPEMPARDEIYGPTGEMMVDPATGLPLQGEMGAAPGSLESPFPWRDVGRIGAQTVGAGAGIAGGTTLGPAGQIAGGALGGAAAGQLYDAALDLALGTNERAPIASGQTAIDAAAGALGPALAVAARPVARALMGGRSTIDKINIEWFERAMKTPHNKPITVRNAVNRAIPAQGGATEGALVTALATGDLGTTAAIFAGLRGLAATRRFAARYLLNKDKVRAWAVDTGAGFSTPAQAATSLAALTGTNLLSDDERETARDLITALESSDRAARQQANRSVQVDPERHFIRLSGAAPLGNSQVPMLWDKRTNRPIRKATEDDMNTLNWKQE